MAGRDKPQFNQPTKEGTTLVSNLPTMHLVAAIATGLYGLISLVGGTIGWVKASSLASLLAGGIAGILLLACAFGIPRLPSWSLGGSVLISVLLVGRFGSVLLKNKDQLSDFLASGAGITAATMIAGGSIVIIVSCAGVRRRFPTACPTLTDLPGVNCNFGRSSTWQSKKTNPLQIEKARLLEEGELALGRRL